MKKIFSVILLIIVIVMVANGVFCHEGKTDSYGGHVVTKDGYIIAYHFHDGQFKDYEIVLNTPVKAENTEELKKYVRTLDMSELQKLGTIRKLATPTIPSQTITPETTSSPTSTPTINQTSTATQKPIITPNSTKIEVETLPKTGQKENTTLLFAGIAVLFIGSFIGIAIKFKLTK